MDFPVNPVTGTQYTFGARTWQWNGTGWTLVGGSGGGGGSTTPGGPSGAVQYNAASAFSGDAGLTFDPGAQQLTAPKITATDLVLTRASTAVGSGFRIPHGVVPTSPVNGDLWTTTAGVFARINGATVGPFGAGGGGGGGTITWSPVTTFTVSQTSVFSTTTPATNANMTDGSGATGTGTNNTGNPEWIAVDMGSSKLIGAVQFGGGSVAVFGSIAPYLNLRIVEYWTGSAWAFWFTIPSATYADSGLNQFFIYMPPTLWRQTSRVRIRSNGADYVATTEFIPYEVRIV